MIRAREDRSQDAFYANAACEAADICANGPEGFILRKSLSSTGFCEGDEVGAFDIHEHDGSPATARCDSIAQKMVKILQLQRMGAAVAKRRQCRA
jgi:hypothetical protein